MQINNGDYDPLKPLSEIIKYENVWLVFNINFFSWFADGVKLN